MVPEKRKKSRVVFPFCPHELFEESPEGSAAEDGPTFSEVAMPAWTDRKGLCQVPKLHGLRVQTESLRTLILASWPRRPWC